MFDLNSVFIGLAKIILGAGFIFMLINFCIKVRKDMGEFDDFETFWIVLWDRRWRMVIIFILFIGMAFAFNLEQVHRPKSVLTDTVAPTTMGYDEAHEIVIRTVDKVAVRLSMPRTNNRLRRLKLPSKQ